MNLIQINERLKDLPMQVIQQYANGMNPEIPPYLALGELQRRELSAKQMANQGGASGPQQSVKEQVEQKAGLMELQKMQQQQMAQQQIQPRGPMPAPAGIPQPEAQPETMMARGGLAGVPMRRDMFEYADGGIIAFADGGPPIQSRHPSMNEQAATQMDEKGSIYDKYYGLPKKERDRLRAEATKPLDPEAQRALNEAQRTGDRDAMMGTVKILAALGYDVATVLPRLAMGAVEDLSNTRLGRALGVDFTLPEAAYGGDRSPTPQLNRVLREEMKTPVGSSEQAALAQNPNITQETMDRVGPMTAPKYKDPRIGNSGLPAAAPPPSNRAPNNPVGGANTAGLQAAAQTRVNPSMAKLDALTNEPLVKPTEADTLTSVGKLTPQALQQAAMDKRYADQRSRADKERSAYENSRPSGLDELIRVLGQSGQDRKSVV